VNPNTLLLPTVWPRAEPTTVRRCVLLAVLLHVWLVLTLGSAPGGTALPGQGVWGAVNVTLRGPEQPGAPLQPPPTEPVMPGGPLGNAPTPRWGGAVRAVQPAPQAEPGAAQLGDWAQNPQRTAPEAPDKLPQPAARAPVPQPEAPPGPAPEPGRVTQERAVPAPLPTPAPAAPVPVEAPTAVLRSPARQATAAALPLTPSVQAPLQAPGVAAAVVEAPDVAALPPRTLTSDLSRSALRRPDASAPLQAQPAATNARVPDLAATAAPTLAPPVEAPPALRQMTAPTAAPARTVAPLASEAATAPAVVNAPTAVDMPQLQALPPATSPSVQGAAAPGAGQAAANAGARLGQDVATLPSQAASAPRLNLQLPRMRGGELSRGMAGGGALPVLPRPPEVDDKLGKKIEKSAKEDCRKAYAGAGVLAVVPLAVDALRQEGGCKW